MKRNNLFMTIYDFFKKISNVSFKIFVAPFIKLSFKRHGKNVKIGKGAKFAGISNISVGNNVFIGEDNLFICTKAQVKIGDGVMFGPNVTIITGGHETRITDMPMYMIKDKDKAADLDRDIIFEGDNWIGANATILRGVTIAKGTVVGAGAVVTHSTEPFSIVVGVPARMIKNRKMQ